MGDDNKEAGGAGCDLRRAAGESDVAAAGRVIVDLRARVEDVETAVRVRADAGKRVIRDIPRSGEKASRARNLRPRSVTERRRREARVVPNRRVAAADAGRGEEVQRAVLSDRDVRYPAADRVPRALIVRVGCLRRSVDRIQRPVRANRDLCCIARYVVPASVLVVPQFFLRAGGRRRERPERSVR
jgi:hypothetical protein